MGTASSHGPEGEGWTRVEQVVRGIAARIEAGALSPGERLPSIRAAATAFGVAKNTAVNAYERLVAAGLVESRPGSGFYVRGRRPQPLPPAPPAAVEAVDSVWLLREQLDRSYEVRVGDGRPPADWMEGSEVGRHLRSSPRPGLRAALPESYGSPAGYAPLRRRIGLMLAERGIHAAPAGILLTAGANHALDLVIRHLVAPGEAVLVDEPGYYPLFGKLRLAKARIVGVRRGPEGPNLADLSAKAAASGARLFFAQSLAQNPTGCSLTLPVAHRLLGIAAAHDLRIVESDPFADVLPAALPRLASLDQLERVIAIGTFAKTLSASLRAGYVAAEPGLIAALTDLKMVTSVNSSGYVERVIEELIASGQYRRHLRRLSGRIAEASLAARETLARVGLPVFGEPGGGFYMWCALPGGSDGDALSREAAARGILLAPGSVFHPNGQPADPMMRVNIAYLGDPRFERFARTMACQAPSGRSPSPQ